MSIKNKNLQEFIAPLRSIILKNGFERQHKYAIDYYNYVDLTGKIEIWEEIRTPGIRIMVKERLNTPEQLKNLGLHLRFPKWIPTPFFSSANRPIVMDDLSTAQFLTITKLIPIANLLSKELRKINK